MSEPNFKNWHVKKCGGIIEIKMPGSAIVLADTPKNLELASFIAAAPETHNALKDLVTCLVDYFGKTVDTFFDDADCDSAEHYFAREFNAAIDALKKARGEE